MATDREPLNLLFVCSGNLCRSPMAAAIAEWIALDHGVEVRTRSAGTLGIVGRPAPSQVIAVCRELGLDLSGHRSRALTAEDVRWADRIVVMEEEHALAVRDLVPEVGETVILLGPYAGLPAIPDPMGSWFAGPYRRTRDLLRTALARLFSSA